MHKRRVIITIIIAIAVFTATTGRADDMGVVPTDARAIRPILVGQPLPAITIKSPDGSPFDLNASVSAKPTILIFFRGGWCPYCTTHLGALQAIEPELVELGYQILAVSPERPDLIASTADKNELAYSVLSDQDMTAARALGIAFRLDDTTFEKYKAYGIDLEKDSGRTHRMLPVPAAFVLDTKGIVRHVYVNPDYKVRIDTDVLLAAAKAALDAN